MATRESLLCAAGDARFAFTVTIASLYRAGTAGDLCAVVSFTVRDSRDDAARSIKTRVPLDHVDSLVELFARVCRSARENGTLPKASDLRPGADRR